ncbi:hypothetical protein CsSME_00028838 [Camellia sinensis var. sinensis]
MVTMEGGKVVMPLSMVGVMHLAQWHIKIALLRHTTSHFTFPKFYPLLCSTKA